MIASHDSYTYLKSKNPLFNLISIFWRCQKINIGDQYRLGVRVFDVRVYRYENKWGVAHGKAHFDYYFDLLISICEYFNKYYPGSILRIYLEDNVNDKNKEILDKFLLESEHVFELYKDMIWEIGTHFPWKTYYKNENFNPIIKEYYCHLFNWNPDKSIIYNIKHFDFSSWCIPLYSKKHNPIITQKMIDDNNVMHIMDYIGIYPKTTKG